MVREIVGTSNRTRDAEVRKRFTILNRDVACRLARRKWQVSLLSILRLGAWYSFPGILLWQLFTMENLRSGAKIPGVFDRLRIDRTLNLDLSYLAEPSNVAQSILAISIVSLVVTITLYLLYILIRTVFSEGIAREFRIFSPHV